MNVVEREMIWMLLHTMADAIDMNAEAVKGYKTRVNVMKRHVEYVQKLVDKERNTSDKESE